VKSKFLIISFAIHIVFGFLVFLSIEEVKEEKLLFLEYQEPLELKTNQTRVGKSALRGRGLRNGKSGQKLEELLRNPVARMGSSEGIVIQDDYDSNGEFGGGSFLQANAILQKPLTQVWSQIRANIQYHDDFFINRMQGSVATKIIVGKYGQLQSLVMIEGHELLREWVKLALRRALDKNFLSSPLPKELLLHLTFDFSISSAPPPISEYQYNHTHLKFNVVGYRNNLYRGVSSIGHLFKENKKPQMSDWSFSKQIEPYVRACELQDNQIACDKLLIEYEKMGMHNELKKIHNKIKRGLKEGETIIGESK
jgi:hypothetical protein